MNFKYVKIDSSQRVNPLNTSPSKFSIRGTNVVFKGRYVLKAVFMPVTYYNVSSTNNLLYFTDANGTHVASIPIGYYTSSTYLATVGSIMSAASPGITYSLVKDSTTLAVTITASSGTFALTFGTNTIHTAATSLGFPAVDTNSTISHLASGLLNLSQTRSFNISVNSITTTCDLNGVGYSFVIPVTANTPGIEYYEAPLGYEQTIYIEAPTRQLDIAVFDDNYEILPLYAEWYMTLQPLSD